MSIERVCVVGGGAIGSLYAAHLSRVADVWVLTRRPEHARALEEQGLEVSGRAEFTGRVHATDDASKLPEVDVAIVATKGTALDAAAGALAGHFPDAMVVTVQNGLGAEQIVRRHGDWPLVSGVTFMSGTRHDDTHIEYILDTETWLGPYNGIAYERVEELAELIQRSGLKARAFPDLKPAQWSKLIFNATVNAVAALTGLPHDPHFAAEEQYSDLGHLVHALMDEGKAVAAAAGIELHEDPWEMNVHATQRGSAHYPSMLEDVEAHRPTEIELITGSLVREAERLGVPVPLHHNALPPDQGERRQLPGIQREAGMTAGKRWGAFGALLAVLALAVAAVGAGVGASKTNAQAPIVIGWAFDSKGNMAPFDGPGARSGEGTGQPDQRQGRRHGPAAADRHLRHEQQQRRQGEVVCGEPARKGCECHLHDLRRRLRDAGRAGVAQGGQADDRPRASAPTRWGRSGSARRASWRSASATSPRTRAPRWRSTPTGRAGGLRTWRRTRSSSTSRTSSRRSRSASRSWAARSPAIESYATGANNVNGGGQPPQRPQGGRDRDGSTAFGELPALVKGMRSLGNKTPILNSWAGDGTYWVTPRSRSDDYYAVTYASVFGDDPDKAVRTLAKKLEGVHRRFRHRLRSHRRARDGDSSRSGGSTNGATLAATMEKFKKVPTLSGLVSFSPQFHSVFGRQYRVIKIENNKARYVGAVTAKVVPKI